MTPKSTFEISLLVVMLIALGYWGYRQIQKPEKKEAVFTVPEEIDGDLVLINRAAEKEAADEIAQRWKSRGYQETIAAVYEFVVLPYKPVFYLGAVKGSGTDRQKILEEEMQIFEGKMREDDEMKEVRQDNVPFLCASFQRGTGLVALSAVCVWDDGKTAGFGLRVAGGAIEDTLRYTAEARKAISNPPPPLPFSEERPTKVTKMESERDRTMRDIVASLKSYSCERFNNFLPAGAEDMFRQRISADLLDTMKDPVERVCFVLSLIEFPRSETMVIRANCESADRCLMILHDPDRFVKDVKFPVVRTSDGWKVDTDWALKQVQDQAAKFSLTLLASDQQSLKDYTDQSAYKSTWIPGIADPFSEPGKVYVATSSDSRSICGSAVSHSGEYFMVRVDETKKISFARGSSPPPDCPDKPLSTTW
ncbi:hypothetical protein L0222_21195 [bacterium]|nr:hypothetical protein [bacterium]